MDEKDLFNKDTMFWRELNSSLPAKSAVLSFNQPVIINNEEVLQVECLLLQYVSHDIEYDMDNGGSFKKNEVKEWPFVSSKDRVNFENENTPEQDKSKLVQLVAHDKIQSIQLKDDSGNVIVEKTKI